MTVVKEKGVSGLYSCDGDCYILVHDNSRVIFKGMHSGEIATYNAVEEFMSESDLDDRITNLGLDLGAYSDES